VTFLNPDLCVATSNRPTVPIERASFHLVCRGQDDGGDDRLRNQPITIQILGYRLAVSRRALESRSDKEVLPGTFWYAAKICCPTSTDGFETHTLWNTERPHFHSCTFIEWGRSRSTPLGLIPRQNPRRSARPTFGLALATWLRSALRILPSPRRRGIGGLTSGQACQVLTGSSKRASVSRGSHPGR
jgi:hypothetical protein